MSAKRVSEMTDDEIRAMAGRPMQEREAALMAAHDDLAALAQRLETKARASGDKTHLGTAAGVRLAAFRLIELAEGIGETGVGPSAQEGSEEISHDQG